MVRSASPPPTNQEREVRPGSPAFLRPTEPRLSHKPLCGRRDRACSINLYATPGRTSRRMAVEASSPRRSRDTKFSSIECDGSSTNSSQPRTTGTPSGAQCSTRTVTFTPNQHKVNRGRMSNLHPRPPPRARGVRAPLDPTFNALRSSRALRDDTLQNHTIEARSIYTLGAPKMAVRRTGNGGTRPRSTICAGSVICHEYDGANLTILRRQAQL